MQKVWKLQVSIVWENGQYLSLCSNLLPRSLGLICWCHLVTAVESTIHSCPSHNQIIINQVINKQNTLEHNNPATVHLWPHFIFTSGCRKPLYTQLKGHKSLQQSVCLTRMKEAEQKACKARRNWRKLLPTAVMASSSWMKSQTCVLSQVLASHFGEMVCLFLILWE